MGSTVNSKFPGFGNAEFLDPHKTIFHFIIFQDLMDLSSNTHTWQLSCKLDCNYGLHCLQEMIPFLLQLKTSLSRIDISQTYSQHHQEELVFFIKFCNMVHHCCHLNPCGIYISTSYGPFPIDPVVSVLILG